jgi:hypothetical protein
LVTKSDRAVLDALFTTYQKAWDEIMMMNMDPTQVVPVSDGCVSAVLKQ